MKNETFTNESFGKLCQKLTRAKRYMKNSTYIIDDNGKRMYCDNSVLVFEDGFNYEQDKYNFYVFNQKRLNAGYDTDFDCFTGRVGDKLMYKNYFKSLFINAEKVEDNLDVVFEDGFKKFLKENKEYFKVKHMNREGFNLGTSFRLAKKEAYMIEYWDISDSEKKWIKVEDIKINKPIELNSLDNNAIGLNGYYLNLLNPAIITKNVQNVVGGKMANGLNFFLAKKKI